MDKIFVGHRSYDPLRYVLLLLDGRDGWHQGMVMEYDAIGIPTVGDRETGVIGGRNGFQFVPFSHEDQVWQRIEARNNKVKDEE